MTRSGRLVSWAVVLLLILAPLPEGSAFAWALPAIEILLFALTALWQVTIAWGRRAGVPFTVSRPFVVPMIAIGAVAIVQLVPLPPKIVGIVSPSTYGLYKLSVPGWPAGQRHGHEAIRSVGDLQPGWSVLPTVNEIGGGASVPLAPAYMELPAKFAGWNAPAWRSLSVDAAMSRGVVLELAAYGCLFMLVFAFPFGADGGGAEDLYRGVVMAALISGLIVAVVGIVELFSWNGKVLWLFVPYDWGMPRPGRLSRAIGPFVNPDHFGNYLALVLPLAAGGALFRGDLFSRERAFRVFSAVSAFLVACALLLTLSRGAWAGASIALAILFVLAGRMPESVRPSGLRGERRRRLRRSVAIVFGAVALSLLFIGPQARKQIDARLQQTVEGGSGLSGRLRLASETLPMVRDYPLLGVGLGCWPEIFPQYRKPPWSGVLYREVHNDYVQLLAETGVLGVVVFGWFFFAAGRRLWWATVRGPATLSPTLAALCAALAVMGCHEFFDFSLHTPANALLFTALLAVALRMALGWQPRGEGEDTPSLKIRMGAVCVSLTCIGLIVCALTQDKIPYPHNIRRARSVAGALKLISAHPAESAPHVELVKLAGASLSAPERLEQLRVAVQLDPTNPYARDMYAGSLLEDGMTEQGLNQISRSVLASPSLNTHGYLRKRLIPWLSKPEKSAVEQGFAKAISRRYPEASTGLAEFYFSLGRFSEAGRVYREAADAERNTDARENYLLNAGYAYARAGAIGNAEQLFRRAIRTAPADARPYGYLTSLVLGPRHQLKLAQKIVAQGVRAGADAPMLYETLGAVAANDGDRRLAQRALLDAVAARPSFTALFRLGSLYLDEKQYARAALIMRRAVEKRPRSADAYFNLGVAEESGYQFTDAERDLSQAVRLAPANAGYRARYVELKRRIARNLSGSQPPSE